MTCTRLGLALIASIWVLAGSDRASAQYSAIATPLHNVGSGYYERMGVGFGGNIGNNVFFNNGGAGNALPPFGGANVGGGANFGFGLRGGGANLNFGFAADSGYNAGMSSVSPSVTVPNGGTGAFYDVQQRPFVTGLVPMVGHFAPGIGQTYVEPRVVSPLAERLSRLEAQGGPRSTPARNVGDGRPASLISPSPRHTASTAERGELSLAEIRAAQTSKVDVQATELEALLEAARLREEAGDLGQALIDYGRAACRVTGLQREEIRAKMRSLREQQKNR
jgi:hypothetical protein